MKIKSIIENYSSFGFSGSRDPDWDSSAAVLEASKYIDHRSHVVVGCAKGIDDLVRHIANIYPEVFYASSFGAGKSSFARRSVAVVDRVRSLNGLWLSFPSGICPPQLSPSSSSSRCFSGSGSGTWASLAYAAGLGLPCLVFANSVPGWGFEMCDEPGWWFRPGGAGSQLSLF